MTDWLITLYLFDININPQNTHLHYNYAHSALFYIWLFYFMLYTTEKRFTPVRSHTPDRPVYSHILIAKYWVNAVIMSKHSHQLWYCLPFSVHEGGAIIKKVSIVASGGVEVNNDTLQISTPT